MEMIKTNGFCEMTDSEMQQTDGGGFWAALGAGALKFAAAVGTACGVGATGGFVIIGASVVAVGVAIYGACNS